MKGCQSMAALFLIQNFSFLLGMFSRRFLCRKTVKKIGYYFYLECLAGGGNCAIIMYMWISLYILQG